MLNLIFCRESALLRLMSVALWLVVSVSVPATAASLKQALGHVTSDTPSAVLVVDAENVALPTGSETPSATASLPEIAAAYHLKFYDTGTLRALASPSMVTLTTDIPENPNIWADLEPSEAFKFLVANLSEAQWQALISDQGIGLSDLDTDVERDLYAAMFPRQSLNVVVPFTEDPSYSHLVDYSSDVPKGRVRLALKTRIGIPVLGHPDLVLNDLPVQFGHPPAVRTDLQGIPLEYRALAVPRSSAPGDIKLTQTVPNALKPSDLHYDDPILQALIPLKGLKTVAEVIDQVQKITHLELVADRHYEDKSVMVVGQVTSASASDVLKSLATCLTGTYRHVGSAYVLTDDVSGVGSRLQKLADFNQRIAALRRHGSDQAGLSINVRHSASNLTPRADLLALNPDEFDAALPSDHGAGVTVSLPLDQLTPAQKFTVKTLTAAYQRDLAHSTYGSQNIAGAPDLNGKITLISEPDVQFLDPTLGQIIDLRWMIPADQLFQGPETVANNPPVDVTAQSLKEVLSRYHERAILVSPRSSDDLTDLIPYMQTNGFNRLWIAGASGNPGPIVPDIDILDAAIKAAQGTGIQVFAQCSLLRSGTSADADSLDQTILGDVSPVPERRRLEELPSKNATANDLANMADLGGAAVSPFANGVDSTLKQYLADLATRKTLSGIIWSNVYLEGYHVPGKGLKTTGTALGYHPSARLAFLRKYHQDPLDLYVAKNTNTLLPNYADTSTGTDDLFGKWTQFRQSKSQEMLQKSQHLLPTIQSEFVEQRVNDAPYLYYASWDHPATLPPPALSAFDQTKAQSQSVLVNLVPTTLNEQALMGSIEAALAKTPGTGLVLDLTRSPMTHDQQIIAWRQ